MAFGNNITYNAESIRSDRERSEYVTNFDYNNLNKLGIDVVSLLNSVNTLAAPINNPTFTGIVKSPTPTLTGTPNGKEVVNVEYLNSISKFFSEFFIGFISPFGGTIAPDGWVRCDGAAISRTTYEKLFARIGTTWGLGNGTTTFNVPDLRAYFLRDLDSGKGIDNGRTIASVQGDAIRNITGSLLAGAGHRGAAQETGAFKIDFYTGSGTDSGPDRNYHQTGFDASRVVPTANENRPKNIAVPHYIFTGVFK